MGNIGDSVIHDLADWLENEADYQSVVVDYVGNDDWEITSLASHRSRNGMKLEIDLSCGDRTRRVTALLSAVDETEQATPTDRIDGGNMKIAIGDSEIDMDEGVQQTSDKPIRCHWCMADLRIHHEYWRSGNGDTTLCVVCFKKRVENGKIVKDDFTYISPDRFSQMKAEEDSRKREEDRVQRYVKAHYALRTKLLRLVEARNMVDPWSETWDRMKARYQRVSRAYDRLGVMVNRMNATKGE